MGHTFKQNTGKTEADEVLNLRPAWSTEQVSGQPSLGSERQKAGEDVIKQGDHVPAAASGRTWQLWPCGAVFRDKDRRKDLRSCGSSELGLKNQPRTSCD